MELGWVEDVHCCQELLPVSSSASAPAAETSTSKDAWGVGMPCLCELCPLPFFFFFFFSGTPFLCGLHGVIFLKKQILLLVQVSFEDGHKRLCLESCPQEPGRLILEALGGSTVPSHPRNTE